MSLEGVAARDAIELAQDSSTEAPAGDGGVTRPRIPRALREAFPALADQGLGAIDVGARGGFHPLFKEVAPLLEVVGFEPDREEWQRLHRASQRSRPFRALTYLPCALGDTDGERTLYLSRLRGTSSFYQPDRHVLDRFPDASRFDLIGAVSVTVRSLDSLRRDAALPMPSSVDFIKIDTQGSELDILRGTKQSLCSQVLGVEVEVEFARLYDGQPLFRDVDGFLATCGFSLFKLRRQAWVRRAGADRPDLSAGQVVFGDALYLRDPLDAMHPWVPQQARQAEALILLATLYDLHDFALELLTIQDMARLVDVERVRRYVMQRSLRLRSVAGRLSLLQAHLRGGAWFRRYAARWTRGDDDFYSAIA